MPKHYTKRKGKRQSTVNRKTRYLKGPGVSVTSNMPSFPTNKIVDLKFSGTFDFDPVADDDSKVGTDNKFVCANNIFFPDVQADSHCPLGYDQWSAFYERWVVVSSRIKIDWLANENKAGINNLVGFHLTDDDDDRDAQRLIEQGACKYKLLQVIANGNAPTTMYGFYNAKSWHTVADVADAEGLSAVFDTGQYADIVGGDTANQQRIDNCLPDNLTYFNIFAVGNRVAEDGGLCSCRYTIEYTVMMKDPRELPRSFGTRPTDLYGNADIDDGTVVDADAGES